MARCTLVITKHMWALQDKERTRAAECQKTSDLRLEEGERQARGGVGPALERRAGNRKPGDTVSEKKRTLAIKTKGGQNAPPREKKKREASPGPCRTMSSCREKKETADEHVDLFISQKED